jgi:Zn-dependent peptidase ImmA (M78 family)
MLNPERVELVRLRLGLTKIGFAGALGVDRKTVQRFEGGTAELPAAAFYRLCDISGYPEGFFEKDSPEYPNPDGVSFRSLRSLTASKRDAAMAAGALAFEFDDWIVENYDLPAHDLIQTKEASPAEAAALLRATWGIGQRPIGNVINFLESHGIRIFSLAEETRHLDAYSLWRNNKPYIFLNTMKTTEHSRFDACHELGHLVMHRHCGSGHVNAEIEANAFSSAFLMPPDDLKAEMPWVRSLDQLIDKKKRWGVSVAALNYALHKIGRITEWNYRGNYIALGKQGKENEPNPLPPETSQVWEKILKDLWQRGIPLSKLAENLRIPEKELNDLLFGIAAARAEPKDYGTLRVVR